MSKLVFPSAVLNQHCVVLGKTGKGKSSVLRYVVEHLLSQNKRVCIIDPKGDWWGLKADDGADSGARDDQTDGGGVFMSRQSLHPL